jgi:homoserine dehydrogenase
MDELEKFLAEVEAYLTARDLTPTAFGNKAAGDPNFVFDLREGREPRRVTIAKVRAFMDEENRNSVSRGTEADAAA